VSESDFDDRSARILFLKQLDCLKTVSLITKIKVKNRISIVPYNVR